MKFVHQNVGAHALQCHTLFLVGLALLYRGGMGSLGFCVASGRVPRSFEASLVVVVLGV